MILKVLVADDDYINRRLLISLLKQELYQVEILEAVNGEEALETWNNNPDIQLILLDIEMPVMDGASFLRHYRENKNSSRPPILAISSNDLIAKEILSLGADAFLIKPVTSEKLLSAILESQVA